jgi:Skp family chaperone for outer membrane proteins
MGVMTLAGAISVLGLGQAQNPTPAGGAPQTRVALINLMQVFKGYNKVTTFANENKTLMQPFQDQAKQIHTQVELHKKALEDKNITESNRIQYEKNLIGYQRQMEDLQADAKMKFAKKNEEQMLIVYKEVMDMAERYAAAHGFELVMHYNDLPKDSSDFYSAGNVSRKLQAGACMPMVIHPGLDITNGVITTLNGPRR